MGLHPRNVGQAAGCGWGVPWGVPGADCVRCGVWTTHLVQSLGCGQGTHHCCCANRQAARSSKPPTRGPGGATLDNFDARRDRLGSTRQSSRQMGVAEWTGLVPRRLRDPGRRPRATCALAAGTGLADVCFWLAGRSHCGDEAPSCAAGISAPLRRACVALRAGTTRS